jgi:hypothetical protein
MRPPTTSERIGVTLVPERLELLPGGQASVVLIVVNRGQVVDEFSLVVEDLDPAWFTVRVGTATLFPEADDRLELDIHLPDDRAIPAGRHVVHLKVRSRATPDVLAALDLPLEILPVGGLQLQLRPQRITTARGGTFRVELISTANAPQAVELLFADPEEQLLGRFGAEALSVPAGATTEVSLAVRPKRRPLLGPPRAYQFSVTALPPAAADQAVEPIGVADGQLVYRPPLALLGRLPRRLQALALALGALALAAGLAVWFLAQPGRRGPLVERAPLLKGPVAALEQALNLPPETEQAGGAGGAGAGGGGGAVGLPSITTLELRPPVEGGPATYEVAWEVQGAQTVSLSGTPQPNPRAGRLALETLQDAEYVLEAKNDAGTAIKSVGIVVLRPPEIEEFTANPANALPGQAVTLTWRVKRAERGSLNGDRIDPAGGTISLSPTADTTYRLIVENELGRTEQALQVRIVQPNPNPAASPSAIAIVGTPNPAAKPQAPAGPAVQPAASPAPAVTGPTGQPSPVPGVGTPRP